METPANQQSDPRDGQGLFLTTRWTLVLRAGGDSAEAEAALAQLCRDYWYPLYAFVRRRGATMQDAQDATQGFFLHVMEGGMLKRASGERGKFRTFLLGGMQHFLANERRDRHRLKRGGGEVFIEMDALSAEDRFALEPVDSMTPEARFDRSWAFALIDRVFRSLGEEFARAGRAALFEKIRPFLAAESARPGYAAVAQELGMSASAVGVTIHRMRQRYGELLRDEILHTVSGPEELDGEIAYLMEVVARG
jgi:DNA-directed RNA polymerase specialized sigma24 family protein